MKNVEKLTRKVGKKLTLIVQIHQPPFWGFNFISQKKISTAKKDECSKEPPMKLYFTMLEMPFLTSFVCFDFIVGKKHNFIQNGSAYPHHRKI